MATPDDKGVSYRETLEGLIERTADPKKRAAYEAELEMPEFPMTAMYLWNAYHRIRRRKGGNGFSAMPIEWPDIDAFARNSGVRLAAWEVATIEALDDCFLSARSTAPDA